MTARILAWRAVNSSFEVLEWFEWFEWFEEAVAGAGELAFLLMGKG